MSDEPYNAADPKAVKASVKAQRSADAQRAEILRGLMSLPAGRAWVFHLLESCHVFQSSYTGDGLSMAFKEGERNVGLRLLSDVMSTCPDQYIQAMREANERSSIVPGRTDTASGDESDLWDSTEP